MRGNGLKLCMGRLRLGIRNNILSKRAVLHRKWRVTVPWDVALRDVGTMGRGWTGDLRGLCQPCLPGSVL